MSKLFNPTLSALLIASFLVVGHTAPAVAQEALWPAKGWPSSTPEAQDLVGSHFAKLDDEIKAVNTATSTACSSCAMGGSWSAGATCTTSASLYQIQLPNP